jgi:hypothetical protein
VEIAKIVLDYIKALAWPTVAFAVAMVYKKQIVGVLARLRKAGLPGGVSLDFSEEVKQVRQLSNHVEALPLKYEGKGLPAIPLTDANARMISVGLQPSPSGLDMDYYRALARQDPNIALAGLRIEVDVLARNLARGFKVAATSPESGLRLLRRLLAEGAITASQFELAEKVMQLCNAAVHGTLVSHEQADAVIDSAEVLARQYLEWLSWGFSDGWKPAARAGEGHLTGQQS